MSSDIPLPTPDPHVEDSWFQRPAFLATCALIVVIIGTALWFLGREADSTTDPTLPTSAVETSGSPDTGASTTGTGASETSGASASDPAVPTTLPVVKNPFGDVVCAPVTEPAGTAGRYAAAIASGTDPAAVSVLHSPAYYYALWSRLRGGGPGEGASAVATAAGYAVTAGGAGVELAELMPADGPIRDGVELRQGVVTPLSTGIQSTGVCQPDREPQCDLSASNFVPDAGGSGAQLWALAKVVVDPAADTWLLYVDLRGARLASATVDSAIHVGVDPALNIVAVTYAKQPPAQTVLTLVGTAEDGTTVSFDFAVS